MGKMKRAAAWLLAAMMMAGMTGRAETDPDSIPDEITEETEDGHAFTEDDGGSPREAGPGEDTGAGDVTGETGKGEPTLTEDPENGHWEYRSETLCITIDRVTEKVKTGSKKKTREYCIADIQASPEEPLYPIMTDPTKKHPEGYKLVSPEILTDRYRPLFAMSDDMYGIRLQRYKYQGIVIRNGEILAQKTRNSSKKRNWPNLDTLALFEDGSMKAYVCDAYTAEEYLEMGARQVFSFGPILIHEGEITEQVLNPKYYPYNEPRAAIGMVAPWHYVAIVVRGRPQSQYAGVHLDWLARKLLEAGCTEALNLDGGQTVTMMFNGNIIETGGKELRSQGSMICFGHMADQTAIR